MREKINLSCVLAYTWAQYHSIKTLLKNRDSLMITF